ncbi:type IV toxin-antitoxin system AbiEi family antitoxin domain-containing protein [Ectothiorhodospira haloalkaliphila]|uniref:type IV toxin-antitoxin system AbiEi family antitoxin domain-containing protein n=1 Tax=Ectothiorhodospira haloalkaliphila TaxID=421628 RepID=UPI001EE83FF4|nr:type IV toxin-antitoxin system AbiEi family antitoxin domain-containing protein [Ectothiorhodospira haloalkaliphila]MCG5525963.1 type IV toxin-antitoxin system AbiEi family antitoxin domain-containing protein [Ectothiorhodospira haloalkaliphila]
MNDTYTDTIHVSEAESAAQLSSEELYALAQKREQEEREEKKEARKAELKALRDERRDLIKSHKKALKRLQQAQAAELAELDSRIDDLKQGPQGDKSTKRDLNKSQRILEVLAEGGAMSIDEIREALDASVDSKNMAQTLNYLARQGRVERVSRGVYQLAD